MSLCNDIYELLLTEYVRFDDLLNCYIAFNTLRNIECYLHRHIIVSRTSLLTSYTLPSGVLYNDNDEPAYISNTGNEHYVRGKLGRLNDSPAKYNHSGNYYAWYMNGVLHRDNDKPAIVARFGGHMAWYVNGILHRDNDKPAYIDSIKMCGITHLTMEWYVDGRYHRDNDKPALIKARGRNIEFDKNGQISIRGDDEILMRGWYMRGLLYRVMRAEPKCCMALAWVNDTPC